MSGKGGVNRAQREGYRQLDDAARQRRQRKQLEALEQDNFQDDPHANLTWNKKAPKFDDDLQTKGSKRKKTRGSELFKQRFRKNFSALLEEDQQVHPDPPNYSSAAANPSVFPQRKFCAVCGFPSNYTCIPCGAKYCSSKCLLTHQDTRCLKWTV